MSFLIDKASEANLETTAMMIRESDVLALVGAGTSMGVGYPSWSELIELLRRHAKLARRDEARRGAAQNDFLWQAELCRRKLKEPKYGKALRSIFHKRDISDGSALDELVQVEFRHFLTTNFDSALEDAFEKRNRDYKSFLLTSEERVRDFFYSLARDRYGSCIVHIHGSVEDVDSIVLSERDYAARYVRSDEARDKLFAILATQRLLFVGFSLTDPDLATILRSVNARLGRGNPYHFAILPAPDETVAQMERERYVEKFGVHPIFYREDEEHSNFVDVIRQLRELSKKRSAPSKPASVRTAVKTRRKRIDPDDPNKGRFGGKNRRGQRLLSATVVRDSSDWYRVTLTVKSTTARKQLDGLVDFHLHDSFDPQVRTRPVQKGVAKLTLWAYGAFTVGAIADGGRTRLELDLSKPSSFPKGFRES